MSRAPSLRFESGFIQRADFFIQLPVSGFGLRVANLFRQCREIDADAFTFFQRNGVPASLTQSAATSVINTTAWGPPSASYPATSCDITEFFGTQRSVCACFLSRYEADI